MPSAVLVFDKILNLTNELGFDFGLDISSLIIRPYLNLACQYFLSVVLPHTGTPQCVEGLNGMIVFRSTSEDL